MGNFSNLFIFKAGALQPFFTVQLYQADGVTPLDLSAATGTRFRLQAQTGTSLLINNSTAGILTGIKNSYFEYAWNPSDWTPVAGRYLAELDVLLAGASTPLTLPLTGYWNIAVIPTLPL